MFCCCCVQCRIANKKHSSIHSLNRIEKHKTHFNYRNYIKLHVLLLWSNYLAIFYLFAVFSLLFFVCSLFGWGKKTVNLEQFLLKYRYLYCFVMFFFVAFNEIWNCFYLFMKIGVKKYQLVMRVEIFFSFVFSFQIGFLTVSNHCCLYTSRPVWIQL